MDFSERKRIRLEDFDYSRNGAYFITLCTQNRLKVLSEIVPVGDGNCVVQISNDERD